jgi:hypothetical protein
MTSPAMSTTFVVRMKHNDPLCDLTLCVTPFFQQLDTKLMVNRVPFSLTYSVIFKFDKSRCDDKKKHRNSCNTK